MCILCLHRCRLTKRREAAARRRFGCEDSYKEDSDTIQAQIHTVALE